MRIPQFLLLWGCYSPDIRFSGSPWLLGSPFHPPHPWPTGERRVLRIKRWEGCPFNGSGQQPLLQERPGVQGGEGGWCTGREPGEGCAACCLWELGRASAQPSCVLYYAWWSSHALSREQWETSLSVEIRSAWVSCTLASLFSSLKASCFCLFFHCEAVCRAPVGSQWLLNARMVAFLMQRSRYFCTAPYTHIKGLWPSGGHEEDYNVPEHYLTVWISFLLYLCALPWWSHTASWL